MKGNELKEKSALCQLSHLCKKLDDSIPLCSVREWRKMTKQADFLCNLASRGREIVHGEFGFVLSLQQSTVDQKGVGVFVKNPLPKEQVVGLYPGTLYLPFEPLFFQSLRNPFIFRCADGQMIDGNHRGISKLIFKSCSYRDTINERLSCDQSWLSTNPINPLAIGQFVNNHTRTCTANVEYVEITIPADFPVRWRRFLPNVHYSPVVSTECERLMKCVVLMTTSCIPSEEELLSSYLTIVST